MKTKTNIVTYLFYWDVKKRKWQRTIREDRSAEDEWKRLQNDMKTNPDIIKVAKEVYLVTTTNKKIDKVIINK